MCTLQDETLCTSLLDMIRSKTDAEEIVRVFYELHGGLSPRNLFRHRRLFLRAATEHDHTELRVLLLTDTHHGDPSEVIRNDEPPDTVHTIEIDHEIVKLLLSRDLHQKQEGIRRLLSAGPTAFKPEDGRRNPLECFTSLGKLFYERKLTLALPEIVHLLIDAGADVFPLSSSGITPLNSLMKEVEYMKIDDVDLAREGFRTILETTGILLEAGLRMSRKYTQKPLDHLLNVYVDSSNLITVRASSLQYKLISVLYELLLTHIEITNGNETFGMFLHQASMISSTLSGIIHIPGCLEHCNSIIESFANILRCIFLAAARETITIPDRLFFDTNHSRGFIVVFPRTNPPVKWSVLFCNIVSYASQQGRSTKLVWLMLSILSASDVYKMKPHFVNLLKARVQFLITFYSSILTTKELTQSCFNYYKTVQWIHKVPLPFRLEHLAARAVARAVSAGCLRNISRLGLPDRIEKLVLLKFD